MKIMMAALALNLSGQSVHIRNLGKGLIARGHSVTIAAGTLAETKPLGGSYFRAAGLSVAQIPVANIGDGVPRFVMNSFLAGWAWKRLLREYRPDVLHLHAVTLAPQAHVARLASMISIPVVSTFNNEAISPNKRKLAKLGCRIYRGALGDRVIGISSSMERVIAQMGVRPDQIRKIDYAVDDEHFRPPSEAERHAARHDFGLLENEVAVCCLARLEPRKNQGNLIRAIAALRRNGHPVRLLLAGDDIDGYAQELRAITQNEEVTSGVSFLGFQDPRKVAWAADVNALVSFEEGFGLVVIEAAMTGLPPIRSRSAGSEDQVTDEETGLIVDPHDVSSIEAALEKLVSNADLRSNLGRAANESARRRYTLENMARQVEAVYKEVAKGGSAVM